MRGAAVCVHDATAAAAGQPAAAAGARAGPAPAAPRQSAAGWRARRRLCRTSPGTATSSSTSSTLSYASRLELSANLREVSQCLVKAPTRAFSLLKALKYHNRWAAFRIFANQTDCDLWLCIPISCLLTMGRCWFSIVS